MLQLERTIEAFHGDRSRLDLTGFSMGGAGTYRIAHRWPDASWLVTAPADTLTPLWS
jgi:predicted peptidase